MMVCSVVSLKSECILGLYIKGPLPYNQPPIQSDSLTQIISVLDL